jgi:Cu-Zn family superoxide dismutase
MKRHIAALAMMACGTALAASAAAIKVPLNLVNAREWPRPWAR